MYKSNHDKFDSFTTINSLSSKNLASKSTILDRNESRSKTIKITNNRALQFLIRDSTDEPHSMKDQGRSMVKVNKSHFHPSNKSR